jgi:hypothetical protein
MSALQGLPRLNFQPAPVPAADIGDKGELVWLPLKSLAIDPVYQRAILDSGKANIRRMIEGFSWLLFGTLVVARRGRSTYAVIDGQHRATAALMHGRIRDVPCLVLKGGIEAEARAFSAINANVTRIHALQSFRASVAAGDIVSRNLVAICARANVSIAPYPKPDLDPGETMALGTVRICLRRHGEKLLVAALKLLRAADGDAGLGASSVMGTCDALSKNEAWAKDPERSGASLTARGGGLAAVVERARARKATRGGPEWVNFSAVVSERLGTAQRNSNIPMSRLMAGR